MPGTLHRLFTFAKATKARPLENFTTEALAAAIRAEPSAFAASLASTTPPIVSRPAIVDKAQVETQVHVSKKGIVDLVVELMLDGTPTTFWIEVKAHAGLHGHQLDTYEEAAGRVSGDAKPRLIMLCKRPMADVPTLRWNDLRAQIDDGSHLYWRDLRQFLEDNRMADDFDRPITTSELGVVPTAHSLLRKTARLAFEFLSTQDHEHWRAAKFPDSESKVVSNIAQQFRRKKRLVVYSKRYPTICFGLRFDGNPKLSMWIEFRPTDSEAREAVFAAARAGNLPPAWSTDSSGWASLGAQTPVEGELDQERAIAWLSEKVTELREAGVLEERLKWRRKGRIGRDDVDEP